MTRPAPSRRAGIVEILQRFARTIALAGLELETADGAHPGILLRLLKLHYRSFRRGVPRGSWRATASRACAPCRRLAKNWPRRHPVAAWRRSPRRPRWQLQMLADAALFEGRPAADAANTASGTLTRRTRHSETTPPTSSPLGPRPAAAPGQMGSYTTASARNSLAGTTLDGSGAPRCERTLSVAWKKWRNSDRNWICGPLPTPKRTTSARPEHGISLASALDNARLAVAVTASPSRPGWGSGDRHCQPGVVQRRRQRNSVARSSRGGPFRLRRLPANPVPVRVPPFFPGH